MLSERVNKIAVSPTLKVAAEAKKMKSEGINVIDLSLGEPDFPTPQNIKDAAKKALDNDYTHYTINAGIVELRKAIQTKLKNENNLDYSLTEIIVSSGAKQSLFNAIHTIIYDGDEVIIPTPYWVSYPEMVSLAHGTSKIIEGKEENDFKITPDQLSQAITPATKALILCNPSNPTGSFYSKEELSALADVCSGKDFLIISDEIYEKLLYDGNKFTSIASINDEMKRRTIIVNGVSKSYSMTGWRIGYTAGPEPIIKGIDKIQSHSTSNAASISQYAALEAITGPQDELEMMRAEFERRRNYLYAAMNNIKGIICRKPGGAFYVFPNITAFYGRSTSTLKVQSSFDFSMYLLYEAKVAVVPGSAFGAEGFIRISYAASMDNLIEAVNRIELAVEKLT